MKKIFVLPAMIVLLVCLLPSCVKEEDHCKATEAETINRSIQVEVTVTEEGGNPYYSRPAAGEIVSVEFTKYPCGEDPKGYFKMDGVTDVNGRFFPTMPNYNFNNIDDQISVTVTIPYTMDNGTPDEYSEGIEITYNEAIQYSGNVIVDFPVTLAK